MLLEELLGPPLCIAPGQSNDLLNAHAQPANTRHREMVAYVFYSSNPVQAITPGNDNASD
jgi:hypothetical protein